MPPCIYINVDNDIFYYSCVGIEEYQAADIDIYVCPKCQPEHGPLVCKFTYMHTIFFCCTLFKMDIFSFVPIIILIVFFSSLKR